MRFSWTFAILLAVLVAGCTSPATPVPEPEPVIIKAEQPAFASDDPPTTSVVRVIRVFEPVSLGQGPVAARDDGGSATPHAAVVTVPGGLAFGFSALILLLALLLSVWTWRLRSYPRLLRRTKKALVDGRYGQAAHLASKACKRSSEDPNAWFLYGTALVRQGKYEQAVRDLGNVMGRLDPHVSGLAFLLAYSHLKQDNLPAARPWLPLVARDETLWKGLGAETQFLLLKSAGRPKKASTRDDPSYV